MCRVRSIKGGAGNSLRRFSIALGFIAPAISVIGLKPTPEPTSNGRCEIFELLHGLSGEKPVLN